MSGPFFVSAASSSVHVTFFGVFPEQFEDAGPTEATWPDQSLLPEKVATMVWRDVLPHPFHRPSRSQELPHGSPSARKPKERGRSRPRRRARRAAFQRGSRVSPFRAEDRKAPPRARPARDRPPPSGRSQDGRRLRPMVDLGELRRAPRLEGARQRRAARAGTLRGPRLRARWPRRQTHPGLLPARAARGGRSRDRASRPGPA